ncbi:MAG: hypothetical protein IJX64_01880 [Clostridia bacterium]|nr:hypothetical protein [Clostridia bacterium]
MQKIKNCLLACLVLVSLLTCSVSAALPEVVEPLWNNTNDVALVHNAVGTTAHCSVDISIASGAIMRNVSIRLIESGTADVVKEWVDPEMTVLAFNTYSFYGTAENIVVGNTYRLTFQCEVWKNGVCDYISLSSTETYSATE